MTGGTGFVGGHLLDRAAAAGYEVRALTRRPQSDRPGVTWIEGALSDADALARLAEGADAAVHVAGAINARGREGFDEVNVGGTEAMIAAAERASVRRFVHISSLAAREPEVSLYGWSKARSEEVVKASPLDWTILRPPAVYGPGDRETLELFRMASRGWIALPPKGRLSLIAAADLCGLILACLDDPASVGGLYEPDDGTAAGLTHREFAAALGRAVGRRVRAVHIAAPLVHLGARLDRAFRREGAKLTPDRARYFCHPDWVAAPHRRPPPALWTPAIALDDGLRETASWYREQGWLA